MNRAHLWLAATALASCGSAALAQAVPEPAAPATPAAPAPAPAETADASDTGIADIVVTATRQNSSLSKVPISISAFSGTQLQNLAIKSFADLVRFTPGVQFNNERKDIAIRGISSEAGTGTTGLYIDDTPVQMRALGLNANNTAPIVFDLERIEVLRGPQGTLFGAGSEGGTVRYITPQPSLTTYSSYSRAELNFTEGGSPSYEIASAIGGPIIGDKLGFRASGYFRHDGGYIDRVDYQTLEVTTPNANSVDTYVLRGALAWQPVETVTITPTIMYQNRSQKQNDRYWVGLLDETGELLNGTPDVQADNDHFTLASLNIEAELGAVTLISNTSYYDRSQVLNGYSGTLYNLSLFQQLLTNDNGDGTTGVNFNFSPYSNPVQQASADGYPLLTSTGLNLPQMPDYVARVFSTNQQQNWTQEVRLQSTDASGKLNWVAGLFYQSNRQVSIEQINDPMFPDLVPVLFGGTLLEFTEGIPLLPNGDAYINQTTGYDEQLAFFGNVTWSVTEKLKLNVGLRYALTNFNFTNFADGAQNVGFSEGEGSQEENPLTPRFGIEYQIDSRNLVYFNAAKGFRIGGANPPFPQQACQPDLDALGITSVPDSFNSDSVWSYELGTKNRLFDNKLSIAASAYYLEWSNIQQANYLPSCGFQYTANVGTVTGKGFDAQITWAAADGLNFDLAVGYTNATFSEDVPTGGPGTPLLASKGNTIPGVAPWTIAAGLQYGFDVGTRPAYARIDYLFRSFNPALTPIQDTNNAVSDPALVNDPATSLLNIRSGMTFYRIEAQLFIANLLNARPQLSYTHQDEFTLLFEAQTFRPRSYGMVLSYAF